MSLLIKGGRVIDPATNTDEIMDILLEKGEIKKISKSIDSREETLNVSGKIVSPGLIDMHTHLREPGREDEETIQSGTYAAARGGFTTICCMPNTTPAVDNPSVVKFIYEKAKKEGIIEVLPIGAISKERKGEELSEMGRMWKAGVVAFSDDGSWVKDTHLMRRALEYAKMFNLPLISHCEDKTLSQDGVMNEGYFSTILGLKGIPREAEEIAVFRDITLSKMTGSPLHIAHLSSAGSVKLIEKAKKSGIKVSAEVTPHHFTLTEKEVTSFNTNTRINPPLRGEEDLIVLKEGLKNGIIEVIATDHAPHSQEEKESDYVSAPFGLIGLETALSLVIKELVEKRVLSLIQALSKLTINPARILKINRGRIKEGVKANLVIFDLNKSWVVREEDFLSRSSNSPFIGWKLPGVVEWTIFEGKIVYRNTK